MLGGERIVNGQTEEEEQLSRLFAYGWERRGVVATDDSNCRSIIQTSKRENPNFEGNPILLLQLQIKNMYLGKKKNKTCGTHGATRWRGVAIKKRDIGLDWFVTQILAC